MSGGFKSKDAVSWGVTLGMCGMPFTPTIGKEDFFEGIHIFN
jgi:hypothetical protein